jgi:protein gp37
LLAAINYLDHMGQQNPDTGILWCDYTFNPWIGCTKVSEGCAHCFAETKMAKRYGRVEWGKGNPRQRTSESNWRQPLRCDFADAKSGQRKRVFCASLADVFDQEVRHEWRMDLYTLICRTRTLDWLILTKRPEVACTSVAFDETCRAHGNVWLGFSAEDQDRYNERVSNLESSPARLNFIGAEPLLGPINLHLDDKWIRRSVHWVIVGGEGGPGARPMDLDWVRDLRDQCVHAKIPFFFKQVGGKNKKAPGRSLNGRTWEEFPKWTTCSLACSTRT